MHSFNRKCTQIIDNHFILYMTYGVRPFNSTYARIDSKMIKFRWNTLEFNDYNEWRVSPKLAFIYSRNVNQNECNWNSQELFHGFFRSQLFLRPFSLFQKLNSTWMYLRCHTNILCSLLLLLIIQWNPEKLC